VLAAGEMFRTTKKVGPGNRAGLPAAGITEIKMSGTMGRDISAGQKSFKWPRNVAGRRRRVSKKSKKTFAAAQATRLGRPTRPDPKLGAVRA
jgi:hypothetical protein